MTPPRVLAAAGVSAGGNPGKDGGARFRGASGTPPPTGCPGMGGSGRSRRGGAPRPTDGDMETLRGLRGHPFPGRRTVGAGHARPGVWREHPSMVRSVGRGLDPSAGDCPGDGRWRKVLRGVGDAAPYGLPRNGWQRKPAPHPALRGHLPPRGKARAVIPPGPLAAAEGRGGVRAPRPTDGDMETLWGLRGQPFPGRRAVGAGHARPGGWRGQAFPFYRLTPPTSPPAYSRCCRRQNRWGRSTHRPHARFRRWIRSRGASGHRRSGPEGTGVCRRRNFSAAG